MEENIMRSIRLVEGLKCELLHWTAYLFQAFLNGPEKTIQEGLCNIILFCYLLSNRVGISFKRMEECIDEQAKLYLKGQEHGRKGLPEGDLLDFLCFRETHRL